MKPINVEPIDFDALRKTQLKEVDVAVIDSGVDSTHPDLAGRVKSAWCAARNEESRTEACKVQLPISQDEHGHGTSVAGIVAAVAPNAVIHDYRIFAKEEASAAEGMLACLEAAIEARIRIINMSLAVNVKFADKVRVLLECAYRQGLVVIASQRNFPGSDLGLPAELSYSVGVDLHGEGSRYALNYRPDHPIRYIAHGENIVAPAPGGGYTEVTGTSFATPTVSGLCALLLGRYPTLEHFELKLILKSYALSNAPRPAAEAGSV